MEENKNEMQRLNDIRKKVFKMNVVHLQETGHAFNYKAL